MRIYREDQPDLWESPPEVFRDDRLRELVDELPAKEQHMVSRVFFGGATVTQAVAELGLFVKVVPIDKHGNELAPERRPDTVAGKKLLESAKGKLRRALQEED